MLRILAAWTPHPTSRTDPTVATLATDARPSRSGPAARRGRLPLGLLPGLALCAGIAGLATLLAHVAPLIGAPVFGIVLGVLVGGLPGRRAGEARLAAGIAFSSRTVLQLSIVVLGSGLSLAEIARTGLSSLPVMVGTLALALLVAWGAGRLLGIDGGLGTLIGVGTAICGASAIAATTAVIGAAEAEVAYAISTIFAFNVIAVLTYPALGHLLGLSQHAFGLWAGTAINDTSSVVAAAYSYGHAAGDYGVVVKLTRTLMIIPITLVLAVRSRRAATSCAVGPGSTAARSGSAGRDRPAGRHPRLAQLVPWFLVGFLAAAGANSLGLIPRSLHAPLSSVALFLIAMALAAIGLSVRPRQLKEAGLRPLALGAVLWVTVAVSSLALQAALRTR